jgi:Tfp pilus assembly protein PilV
MTTLVSQRMCEWCHEKPIPAHARADAKTCSKKCRQALHRSRVNPAAAAAGSAPMHFGYYDPPYPGLADRYYSHDERCAEVDHTELVAQAMANHPHGWALSTSKAALEDVLAICRAVIGPNQVRTSIWVKGSRHGDSWHERNAYEPVILYGGRPRKLGIGDELDDVLIWGGRQHSHPDALVGMKNAPFAEWMFRQLGALAGDFLTDVFPGSGIIMRAWLEYGGRDPNEKTPTLRLPFDDIVTAPPIRLASTPSRLEEAVDRARVRLDGGDPDAEVSPRTSTTEPKVERQFSFATFGEDETDDDGEGSPFITRGDLT